MIASVHTDRDAPSPGGLRLIIETCSPGATGTILGATPNPTANTSEPVFLVPIGNGQFFGREKTDDLAARICDNHFFFDPGC